MKASLFLIALLAGIVLLTSSCSNDCEKSQNLFRLDFQSLQIDLDETSQLYDLLDQMDSIYCKQSPDADWPVLVFDPEEKTFTKGGKNSVVMGVEPTPCNISFEYDAKQILEIIKDGNNYSVEQERVPLDSINLYIKRHYLNYGKDERFAYSPEGVGIWLITYGNTPMEEMIPLLDEVRIGFREVCEQYTQDQFGKSVCKLEDSEYAQLRELFPFHLAFKTYKDPQINIHW